MRLHPAETVGVTWSVGEAALVRRFLYCVRTGMEPSAKEASAALTLERILSLERPLS